MNYAKLFALSVSLLVAAAGTSAHAAGAGLPCGVTGAASAGASVTYDPFSPNGISSVPVSLTLTRATDGGGKKTQEAYFILTKPAGTPAYQVQATIPGGTTYSNVLYGEDMLPSNIPVISNVTPGQIAYNFGGAASPDTVTLNLLVTVPANVDLSAGGTINLGIRYVCKGTGGMPDVTTPTNQPNAITIDVHVLSGLRTFYAGSALDFGEIGTVTTASLVGSPQRTPSSNYVAVQSSGAYSVELRSANAFKLKNGGSTANDAIGYSLKFLGLTATNASAAMPGALAISRICKRAGVPQPGQSLYIQATLLEGGQGKNPSPSYSDVLTVTVAPLISTNLGVSDCGTYTLP